jgi:hypothetical protein
VGVSDLPVPVLVPWTVFLRVRKESLCPYRWPAPSHSTFPHHTMWRSPSTGFPELPNKLLQTEWIKTIEIYLLPFSSEARSLKSKCWQSQQSKASRAPSLLLSASGHPEHSLTYVGITLICLHLTWPLLPVVSYHLLFVCMSVSEFPSTKFSLVIRILVILD